MSIARSSLGWFTANVLSAIVAFASIAYFSRVLGASVLGVYFLFGSALNLLNLFSNAGLQAATIKRMSEGRHAPEYFAASLLLRLVPLAFVSLVIVLISPYLDSYIGAELSFYLIPILALMQFSDLGREALHGEKKVGRSGFVDLAQLFARVAAQMVLVALGMGVVGLVAGMGVGLLLSSVLGLFLLDARPRVPRKEHFVSMLSFSRYSFGNAAGGYIYEWAGVAAIGLFSTKEAVGIYGVCLTLSGLFLLASQAVTGAMYPRLSELSIKGKLDEIRGLFSHGMFYSPLLVFPALAGSLVIAEDLLGVVYGPAFRMGRNILVVLLLARLLQSLQMVSVRVLEGMNRPDIVFRVNAVTTLVNLAGAFVLVKIVGTVGAAVATALTIGLSFAWNTSIVARLLETRPPFRELSRELVSAVIMGALVWLIARFFALKSAGNIALVVVTGAVAYLAFVLWLSEGLRMRIFSIGKV